LKSQIVRKRKRKLALTMALFLADLYFRMVQPMRKLPTGSYSRYWSCLVKMGWFCTNISG